MTTAVKRACDACHRRKVKCDGINPCRNCSASQLSCTYNAIPQKKGPKGSRAKVISELRETQRQTSLSAKVQCRLNGVGNSPQSPGALPTAGLMAPEMVKESIDFFFANMYPIMPFLQRQQLEQQIMFMDTNVDTYCFFTSMCAFMALQPGMNILGGENFSLESMPCVNLTSANLLVEETIRLRKAYESPSFTNICTSFFLFASHFAMELHEKAWFYLREATTLVHMSGMNKEDTYLQYDAVESSRRRRLFWLLFVMERRYALQHGRPLTLQATINAPGLNDDPSDPLAHQLNSFLLQVNLFRPFDDAFVTLWNKTRSECSQSLITSLQKQLSEILPPYLTEEQSQLSEIQVNQQFLKNLNWQLHVANSNAGDAGMQFQYPIDIARDLLPMVSHFPSSSRLGLHGLGLIEKLYSITCSLTEYLTMQPAPRDPFTTGPRQRLHQLLNIVTLLRSGNHRFLPLLLSKVHEVLPRQANPMLLNAPENAAVCNIDIFDGFGNAGMAQQPVFPADEFDNKYSVQRIEGLSPNSGTSSGSAPSNDMNPQYVNSPAVMSSSIELPVHIKSEYNSIPEMVMSPMNHAPGASMNGSGAMSGGGQQSQHQHQHQHQAMPGYQSLNPQIQNISTSMSQPPNLSLTTSNLNISQGIGSGMGTGINGINSGINGGMSNGISNGINSGITNGMSSPIPMNGNNMMGRPQQRTSSFSMAPQQIRTIGDFHAVQRANTDMNAMNSLSMGSIGAGMDFNSLPR